MNYILVRSDNHIEHKLFKKTDKTNSDGSRADHKYIERIKSNSGWKYIYENDQNKTGRNNAPSGTLKQKTDNFISKFSGNINTIKSNISSETKNTTTKFSDSINAGKEKVNTFIKSIGDETTISDAIVKKRRS